MPAPCAGFGDAARLSVPTPEHYLPMLVVLGARRPDDEVAILTEGIELGSIGMLSFALAPPAARAGATARSVST